MSLIQISSVFLATLWCELLFISGSYLPINESNEMQFNSDLITNKLQADKKSSNVFPYDGHGGKACNPLTSFHICQVTPGPPIHAYISGGRNGKVTHFISLLFPVSHC